MTKQITVSKKLPNIHVSEIIESSLKKIDNKAVSIDAAASPFFVSYILKDTTKIIKKVIRIVMPSSPFDRSFAPCVNSTGFVFDNIGVKL